MYLVNALRRDIVIGLLLMKSKTRKREGTSWNTRGRVIGLV